MIHGRESFADSRADGAEDEERREVNVTYQCPAQQAAIFVFTLNTAVERRKTKIEFMIIVS